MPSQTITRDTRIRRARNVLATLVEGELVCMDIRNGLYVGMDTIATNIWTRLDEPTTAATLVPQLCTEYAADAATIERDVLALLNDMLDRELLDVC